MAKIKKIAWVILSVCVLSWCLDGCAIESTTRNKSGSPVGLPTYTNTLIPPAQRALKVHQFQGELALLLIIAVTFAGAWIILWHEDLIPKSAAWMERKTSRKDDS